MEVQHALNWPLLFSIVRSRAGEVSIGVKCLERWLGPKIVAVQGNCGHYKEVILEIKDAFNWLLLLSSVHCRAGEVLITVNVWNVGQDKTVAL